MRTLIGITGALALAVPLWPVAPATAISNDVVISQVYGGGGSAGSTYRNDYIELFNRGASVVSLTGMSVQYTSATGTGLFQNGVTALSGTLQPGQYYLVQEFAGASGATLPTPDATGTIAMGATDGKVALVNSTTGLGCNGSSTPCSSTQLALIKDLVGYGAANFFEGTAAPALSATKAAIRNTGGCTETDTNGSDFAATTPNPRNTSATTNPCNIPDTAPTVSMTVPADGASHAMDADLGVTFSEAVNVADPWFSLTCAGQPLAATVSGGPQAFVLNPATDLPTGGTCQLTVLAASVTDQDASDPPDVMVSDYMIQFTPYDPCVASPPTIAQIQGSGPTAAITGPLSTMGVVTSDFEGSARLGGFYLQDPISDSDPATSEGIFVYTGNADLVSVGDRVRVTGYARERYGETVLNSANSDNAAVTSAGIRACGTAAAPPPTRVMMPLTDPERYEGMRVTFGEALQVADSYDFGRYGEFTLALPLPGEARLFTGTEVEWPGAAALAREQANKQRQIIVDDAYSAQNPTTLFHPNGNPFSLLNTFRLGDTVTDEVGVLGYGYDAYRVYPTGFATFASAGARPTTHSIDGLRIATLNAGNFFLTGNSGAAVCGPHQDQLCRGWDTSEPTELTRQRTKLLAALSGLDADIIAA
ncbi:MAG: lamin tail domain-containing protein [Candidatus Nanopelagicales bacterium]